MYTAGGADHLASVGLAGGARRPARRAVGEARAVLEPPVRRRRAGWRAAATVAQEAVHSDAETNESTERAAGGRDVADRTGRQQQRRRRVVAD